MQYVEDNILGYIDSKFRDIFRRYFLTLQPFCSTAYSVHNNMIGFHKSGQWPPNEKQILSQCPLWDNLNYKQQVKVLDSIPIIAAQMLTGEAVGRTGFSWSS